jgi:hypothetical protein
LEGLFVDLRFQWEDGVTDEAGVALAEALTVCQQDSVIAGLGSDLAFSVDVSCFIDQAPTPVWYLRMVS